MKLNAFIKPIRVHEWLFSKILLVMKLTTFLLVITLMQVSAKGYSQRISLHETNIHVDKLLRSIEKQSGYVFVYNNNDVQNLTTSININSTSIEQTLNACFKDLPLTYKIVDKNIVIAQREKSFFEKLKEALALPVRISGTVTDDMGIPLPGVNIRLKGTGNAWTSSANGNYNIVLPDSKQEQVLVFSYIGFKTREIKITESKDNLVIKMETDLGKLDEVKVIGYGTTTQRTSTGPIAGVNASDLEKMPLNDPILELQNRVPGLQVTPSSGLPGSSPNVLIRGVNSLNRSGGSANQIDVSNSPLYIVDGVPFISSPLNPIGVSTNMGVYNPNSGKVAQSSPFKSINPDDIESIQVLKDAGETAIYGSRGANGVIIITTKRAKVGKTNLDINFYQGVGKVPYFINTLNTTDYLAMRREAYQNDGVNPASDPSAKDLNVYSQTAYTDWQRKYAGGTANSTNAEATLSGGDEQTRFAFNTGYRNQTTVFPGDYGLKQGSFRLNLDHNSLNKKFTFNISTFYTTDINKLLSTDPFSYYTLPPNYPLYNANGTLNFDLGNPQADFLRTYQTGTKNLNTNVIIGYQILKGLHFKTSFGYNRIQMDEVKVLPLGSYDPTKTNSSQRSQSTDLASTYLVEPQLDYSLQLGKGILQALAGGTYQETQASYLFLQGQKFTNDDLLGNIAAATTLITQTSQSDYIYESLFARLNYNWDGKYILNLTGRRDGSSRFGPDSRFGNFGAVGAAWIFTEEQWMKDVSFLSFGKLRGSYGVTGNDKIGDYQYYNTYQPLSTAPYQTVGYTPVHLDQPNYKWETNTKTDVGIELGFFKDRILLTADYYSNITGNSLVAYPLPSQAGFTSVTENLNAKIQNSGFEFTLNTENIKNKNFAWKTSFNLSLQRNKLLSFPNLAGSPYANQYAIGQSINNIYGFVFTGVDPKDGSPVFKDLNGDGPKTFPEFNSPPNGDQAIIANALPDFYGGFSNTFVYKNWQLDVFFSFRKLDATLYTVDNFAGLEQNIDHGTSSRWQKVGDITNVPRYTATGGGTSLQTYYNELFAAGNSSNFLVNASYVKLSNASLSYTLPKLWMQAIGFHAARLYMSGQNLFTISNYPGPDPETGLNMPALRTVVIGAKISL